MEASATETSGKKRARPTSWQRRKAKLKLESGAHDQEKPTSALHALNVACAQAKAASKAARDRFRLSYFKAEASEEDAKLIAAYRSAKAAVRKWRVNHEGQSGNNAPDAHEGTGDIPNRDENHATKRAAAPQRLDTEKKVMLTAEYLGVSSAERRLAKKAAKKAARKESRGKSVGLMKRSGARFTKVPSRNRNGGQRECNGDRTGATGTSRSSSACNASKLRRSHQQTPPNKDGGRTEMRVKPSKRSTDMFGRYL